MLETVTGLFPDCPVRSNVTPRCALTLSYDLNRLGYALVIVKSERNFTFGAVHEGTADRRSVVQRGRAEKWRRMGLVLAVERHSASNGVEHVADAVFPYMPRPIMQDSLDSAAVEALRAAQEIYVLGCVERRRRDRVAAEIRRVAHEMYIEKRRLGVLCE